MKTCRVCKRDLPLAEFHRDRTRRDGRRSLCKTCATAYVCSRMKAVREYRRTYELKYYYGMSAEEYETLVEAQNGVCVICKRNPEGRLAVDHNHATGRIRGLLCRPCNSALGLFGDSPERLRAAAEYLSQ